MTIKDQQLAINSEKGAVNGLATLNGSGLVVQDPVSKGAANGVASLNGSSLVVQNPALRGLANGVASLDGAAKLFAGQIPSLFGLSVASNSLVSPGSGAIANVPGMALTPVAGNWLVIARGQVAQAGSSGGYSYLDLAKNGSSIMTNAAPWLIWYPGSAFGFSTAFMEGTLFATTTTNGLDVITLQFGWSAGANTGQIGIRSMQLIYLGS